MAGQVDYDLLDRINKYLERLLKVTFVTTAEASQLSATTVEEWSALGDYLDLTPEGTKKLWGRVKGLSESELTKLMEEIRPLAGDYNDFRVTFIFVAAVLVYYIPVNPIIDLDGFKYTLSVEAEKKDASFSIEGGLTMINFLGWSLASENTDTMKWAVEYLTKQFKLDSAIFNSSADTLLFSVVLHLAFFNLASQPREAQEELIKKFIWSAFCFGVPMENILREVLLKGAASNNQREYADNFAEILTIGDEDIYSMADKQPMTVGQFVKRFLTFSGGDHGGYMQVKYIGELLKEYGWPEELRYYLFSLLNLYLHLKTGEILSTKRTSSSKLQD